MSRTGSVLADIVHIESRPLAAPPDVQIITLAVTDIFSFAAGQYLEVIHPDGTSIPLSIASPPEQLPRLQLHYRSTPGAAEAARMDELLASGGPLRLQGPAGDVTLDAVDASPLLLVSGGTGISQALCLVLAQVARHPDTPVTLMACADAPADFYFEDLLPVGDRFERVLIADATRGPDNRGLDWLRKHAAGISPQARIVLSGSPAFVWAATDLLIECGVARHRLASDVYAWAPRDHL